MPVTISTTQIGKQDGSAQLITYAGLSESDASPTGLEWVEWADRSVQLTGNFGSGGTVVIEGSNDGSNWATLTDPQGTAISKTAAGIEQVSEVTRYVRPRVSAGTGVSVNVNIVLRRTSGMRA